jgi:hypothetical protein
VRGLARRKQQIDEKRDGWSLAAQTELHVGNNTACARGLDIVLAFALLFGDGIRPIARTESSSFEESTTCFLRFISHARLSQVVHVLCMCPLGVHAIQYLVRPLSAVVACFSFGTNSTLAEELSCVLTWVALMQS